MPDPVTLYCYVDFTEPFITMASKDHKMRKQGTTGKQKHNFNLSSETLSNQEA
jgi:hypothetical protein